MILDPNHREAGEPVVTLALSLAQAEAVQGALSDMLCWVRGWSAAASEEARGNAPIGTETLRELNIAMKRAIERIEK